MEHSDSAEQVLFATPRDEKPQSPPVMADGDPGSPSPGSRAPGEPCQARTPSVYVFNPFTEGYIAHGKAYTPVSHQAMLAEDLASLPQFLCQPGDVVLLPKRPSPGFLHLLKQAGFWSPEFVEIGGGRFETAGDLCQRELGGLRPWAWGPDSVELLQPLFARLVSGARTASQCFNDRIARLYSKAWSAEFLRKVLARCRGGHEACALGAVAQSHLGGAVERAWLCSEQEAGVAVDTMEDALGAVAAIRSRGHHRVVVKEAHGFAGHNAIRLWEPEILPAQRQWLARAIEAGRQVVVEPWLERELDFSVQLEMGPRGLSPCGYTGLVNDRKGQFLANWAEADYGGSVPAKVAALLGEPADISGRMQRLYDRVFELLEAELQGAGFLGPISIDAFVYRTPEGDCRLKPVVEINPRYTMGRLTVELMKRTSPGSCGLFRMVTRAQARAEGSADLCSYAAALGERFPLRLEGEPVAGISEGAVCLNDPGHAQVCLATFKVSRTLNLPGSLSGEQPQRPR